MPAECDSSLLRSLAHWSDAEILKAFQQDPQVARYFIAIYCRYQQKVAPFLGSARQVQHFWRQCYLGLQQLQPETVLEEWLVQQAKMIQELEDEPGLELPEIPPPLACYLWQGLTRLRGDWRFLLVLADHFGWTVQRVRVQLAAEGLILSEAEVEAELLQARQSLFQSLPGDIRALYLASKPG
ncbi:MAG: hypothetical protein Q6K99_06395 [Thermostichales cyanobacterium BF4_bins_65]